MDFFSMALIMGLGSIIISLVNIRKGNKLKKHGATLNATVYEIKKIRGRGKYARYITYRPVLQYVCNDVEYLQDANIAKSEPYYVVGQSVEIYYDTENPNKMVLSETVGYKKYIWFLIIGVGLILSAVISKFI